jgi:hypothetical protein
MTFYFLRIQTTTNRNSGPQQQQVIFRQNSNNIDNYQQQQQSMGYQDSNGKIYDVISDGGSSTVSIILLFSINYKYFY